MRSATRDEHPREDETPGRRPATPHGRRTSRSSRPSSGRRLISIVRRLPRAFRRSEKAVGLGRVVNGTTRRRVLLAAAVPVSSFLGLLSPSQLDPGVDVWISIWTESLSADLVFIVATLGATYLVFRWTLRRCATAMDSRSRGRVRFQAAAVSTVSHAGVYWISLWLVGLSMAGSGPFGGMGDIGLVSLRFAVGLGWPGLLFMGLAVPWFGCREARRERYGAAASSHRDPREPST